MAGDAGEAMTGASRGAARAVHTDAAPAALGPYSQGVARDGWLYTAGQIGLVPGTGKLVGPGVSEQAEQVFANLEAVLAAAGTGFGHVVKATVYLLDMDDFAAVNEIYGGHFEEPYPARSTVAVASLPKGARVEIDLVARVP